MNHKLTWGVLAGALVLAAGSPAEAQRRETAADGRRCTDAAGADAAAAERARRR